jgi:hypothetical protein
MSRHKVLYYKSDDNGVYKIVKRKSVGRKRVLYKAAGTAWKLVKQGMSANEAEAYIKLLGLKLWD